MGDDFDLNARAERELIATHGDPSRWIARKEPQIGFVHRRKVVHVDQENLRAHDVVEARTSLSQDPSDILERLARLGPHSPIGECKCIPGRA